MVLMFIQLYTEQCNISCIFKIYKYKWNIDLMMKICHKETLIYRIKYNLAYKMMFWNVQRYVVLKIIFLLTEDIFKWYILFWIYDVLNVMLVLKKRKKLQENREIIIPIDQIYRNWNCIPLLLLEPT